MFSTLLELAGFTAIVAGVFLLAGLAWALIASGVFVVAVSYLRGRS